VLLLAPPPPPPPVDAEVATLLLELGPFEEEAAELDEGEVAAALLLEAEEAAEDDARDEAALDAALDADDSISEDCDGAAVEGPTPSPRVRVDDIFSVSFLYQ